MSEFDHQLRSTFFGGKITVKVEVYAERFRAQGQYIKVTEALVTYVAIHDVGQPRPIVRS